MKLESFGNLAHKQESTDESAKNAKESIIMKIDNVTYVNFNKKEFAVEKPNDVKIIVQETLDEANATEDLEKKLEIFASTKKMLEELQDELTNLPSKEEAERAIHEMDHFINHLEHKR